MMDIQVDSFRRTSAQAIFDTPTESTLYMLVNDEAGAEYDPPNYNKSRLVSGSGAQAFSYPSLPTDKLFQLVFTLIANDGSNDCVQATKTRTFVAATPRTFTEPWANDSLWSTPLPTNPEVMPDSADRVAKWLAAATPRNVITHKFGVACVLAADSGHMVTQNPLRDKNYDLAQLNSAGLVPVPYGALASTGTDQHLSVLDLDRRRAWDMGGFSWVNGKPVCSYGHTYSIDDRTGIAQAGVVGATASNFPLLGGPIRPEDMERAIAEGTDLGHRMVFCTPCRQDRYYYPATKKGGVGSCGISEGSLTQFNLSWAEINKLPIKPWEKAILCTWQKRGTYHRDGGGFTSLYGEDPINRASDPWPGVGMGGDYAYFSPGIPWNRLRVLTEEMSR